jgi:S1-C subfamily serine protease
VTEPHAPRLCADCGGELGEAARFCGHCGAPVDPRATGASGEPSGRTAGRRPLWLWLWLGVAAAVATALVAGALGLSRVVTDDDGQKAELVALQREVQSLRAAVRRLTATTASLGRRVGAQETAAKAGLAPVAARTLRSVYTIETAEGSGSGWAAWTQGGATFVITADHVVEDAAKVTVRQRESRWTGTVVETDPVDDLALVRVDREIGPPLWQDASVQPTPSVGDTLLLIGSPYGLEGTVTTGVVSRITYNEIQTDAAANPGNSGGPAVDRLGRVVGVLLSGGGENLNFAVPIRRACVVIRDC